MIRRLLNRFRRKKKVQWGTVTKVGTGQDFTRPPTRDASPYLTRLDVEAAKGKKKRK